MLAGLAKSLLLRIAAYALFLGGFWLLYQAFQTNNILLGIGGAAAIPTAMWAMTGFRRPPPPKPPSNPQPDTPETQPNKPTQPKLPRQHQPGTPTTQPNKSNPAPTTLATPNPTPPTTQPNEPNPSPTSR